MRNLNTKINGRLWSFLPLAHANCSKRKVCMSKLSFPLAVKWKYWLWVMNSAWDMSIELNIKICISNVKYFIFQIMLLTVSSRKAWYILLQHNSYLLLQQYLLLKQRSSKSNYATRHCKDLQIPRLNTEHAKKSYQYSTVKIWNAIPTDIKELPPISHFKNKLKEFLTSWFKICFAT